METLHYAFLFFFLNTEPNKSNIMAPLCLILDNMLALRNQRRDVQYNSVVICPAMPAIPFSQTLIRLCDNLRCQLNAKTTMPSHSVSIPFIQSSEAG